MGNEYESPKADAARLSLLRRDLAGWLLVLCVLEAGRFAHMRMIVDMAEPHVGREVIGISCGVGFNFSDAREPSALRKPITLPSPSVT